MSEVNLRDKDVIIWDLDGTILDSIGVLKDGLAEVLPKYGHKLPSDEAFRANFHGSLQDTIGNTLDHVSGDEIQAIIADFLVIQDGYYEVVSDHIHPDALDFAARAHAAGKQQVLVTNRAHVGRLKASPRSIVAHSALKDYIDTVICGDDSEHKKPQPEVLGQLLAKLDAQRVVVIGDQFVDAKFAHNLGASAILVDRQGEGIPHLDTLDDTVHDKYVVVSSLNEVNL